MSIYMDNKALSFTNQNFLVKDALQFPPLQTELPFFSFVILIILLYPPSLIKAINAITGFLIALFIMPIYIDTEALSFANQNFLVQAWYLASLYTTLSAISFIIFNILL